MEGWVKLHRKMLEWEWYDDANCFRVFMHLILSANHKDGKWRGITIKRGEHLTSLGKLADSTGLSVSKVRTALSKLESTGEIASHSQAQHTVFKVKKYDTYQGDDTALADESQSFDKPIANQSQADDKALATNKKEKNDKNEKEISNLPTDGKPPASKKFNDDDVRFAEWFYQGLLNNNPQHKKPNFESGGWADAVRLMRERDGRDYDQMADLTRWTLNDSFWKANVLSPAKLREKWDQLTVKMKKPQPQQRPTKHGVDDNNWVDGLINGELL